MVLSVPHTRLICPLCDVPAPPSPSQSLYCFGSLAFSLASSGAWSSCLCCGRRGRPNYHRHQTPRHFLWPPGTLPGPRWPCCPSCRASYTPRTSLLLLAPCTRACPPMWSCQAWWGISLVACLCGFRKIKLGGLYCLSRSPCTARWGAYSSAHCIANGSSFTWLVSC